MWNGDFSMIHYHALMRSMYFACKIKNNSQIINWVLINAQTSWHCLADSISFFKGGQYFSLHSQSYKHNYAFTYHRLIISLSLSSCNMQSQALKLFRMFQVNACSDSLSLLVTGDAVLGAVLCSHGDGCLVHCRTWAWGTTLLYFRSSWNFEAEGLKYAYLYKQMWLFF